jgi:TatD DNase family protein
MAKGRSKRPQPPAEEYLHLPAHSSFAGASSATVVDTHTHLLSTFSDYRSKYLDGKYGDVFEFVRAMYRSTTPPPNKEGQEPEDRHVVEALVDVWCEAPVRKEWKELADSAMTEEQRTALWGGVQYHFVIGLSPVLIYWCRPPIFVLIFH